MHPETAPCRLGYLLRRALGQHLERRHVAHQADLRPRQGAHLINGPQVGEIEDLHAQIGHVTEGNRVVGIVVQHLHYSRKSIENLLEIGMGELEVVLRRQKAGEIVEHQDALDLAQRRCLRLQPLANQGGGHAQQPVRGCRLQLQAQEKARHSQQMAGHGERPASRHHLDDLAGLVHARLDPAVEIQDERQQAVVLRMRRAQPIQLLDPVRHRVGHRRPIAKETQAAAECARLGAHAHFHPETRQENDLGKAPLDLQVGLDPDLWHGQVVQRGNSEISGNPWAIHDQRHCGRDWPCTVGGLPDDFPLLPVHEGLEFTGQF